MNNLLSYCWLDDVRINTSDKDLPVLQRYLYKLQMQFMTVFTSHATSYACAPGGGGGGGGSSAMPAASCRRAGLGSLL